ncbi:MAG: hypothetical protein ACRD8U_23130 [Pyrinomonadaceae bacterium]
MSDYLTNLVERSLNSGNLVTPKLPTLFEPAPITLGPTSRETIYVQDEPAASAEPDFRAPQAGRNWRAYESLNPTDPEAHDTMPRTHPNRRSAAGPLSAEQDAGRSGVSRANSQPPSVVFQPKESSSRTIADHVAVKSRVSDSEHEKAFEPGSPTDARGKLNPSEVTPTQTGFLETNAKREVATQDQGDSLQPAPSRLPSLPEPKTLSTDRKTIKAGSAPTRSTSIHDSSKRNQAEEAVLVDVRRRLVGLPMTQSPSSPANVSQRYRSAEVTSEPTINVTIGRVEVRAIQDSSPRTKPTRQSGGPVMTLEEYLHKQRRGGER